MQNYSLTFPTYFRVAQISLRHHNSAPYMIAQDGGNSQGFFCVSLFQLSDLDGREDHNASSGVLAAGNKYFIFISSHGVQFVGFMLLVLMRKHVARGPVSGLHQSNMECFFLCNGDETLGSVSSSGGILPAL